MNTLNNPRLFRHPTRTLVYPPKLSKTKHYTIVPALLGIEPNTLNVIPRPHYPDCFLDYPELVLAVEARSKSDRLDDMQRALKILACICFWAAFSMLNFDLLHCEDTHSLQRVAEHQHL